MVKYLSRLVKEEVPARVLPANARIQPTQFTRMDSDE
jgi:hypothetical protein